MSVDHRRNCFPSTTIPYQTLLEHSAGTQSSDVDTSSQPGGRNSRNHSRPTYIRTGNIVHAQGSCYLELGSTKVLAAVYGPRDFDRQGSGAGHIASGGSSDAQQTTVGESGLLICNVKLAPFCLRSGRRSTEPSNCERELSQLLTAALQSSVCLHMFPWLCVNVLVYVLEDDGGTLSAAITCSSLALADASVPLYDMVASISMLCGAEEGQFFFDPTLDELMLSDGERWSGQYCGCVTFSYMSQLEQLTCVYGEGAIHLNLLDTAMVKATQICEQIHSLMRRTILDSIDRTRGINKTKFSKNA